MQRFAICWRGLVGPIIRPARPFSKYLFFLYLAQIPISSFQMVLAGGLLDTYGLDFRLRLRENDK
jgi:hypothetical protein